MAKIYWRSIKRGARAFDDIPTDKLKAEVKELAMQEVADGIITAEEYKTYIGEDYPAAE